jgi:chromosomal replication initiator protein
MDLVERITKDIIRGEREYTPELIIERTASYYSLSIEDVTGKSRSKNTALARQIPCT